MFVLFLILIVGPAVVSNFMTVPKLDIMNLQQPNNWNKNDTSGSDTGTAVGGGGASATGSSSTATAGAKLMMRGMMMNF